MIAFQIEPASVCLGAMLAGLPLLAWLLLQHRQTRAVHHGLGSQLQAAQALLAQREQASETERREHTQRVAQLQAEHTQQLENLAIAHQEEVASLKEENARAVDEARKELSIVTFPYESERGDKGWVVDDRLAEVGYQYQMFIRGVPCFEPHKVVVHRLQKKEVNQEKVASLSQQVLGLLENVASKHPAMTVAKKFVPGLR